MKAIEDKHKLKEENEEIQKHNAEEEEDGREAVANTNLQKKGMDKSKKEAEAQANKYIAEFKKNTQWYQLKKESKAIKKEVE
jgi:hypothetical protein